MAKATKVITEVIMPAGEYWVGDPCYAVKDEDWMPWLESADYMSDPQILIAEIGDFSVLGIGTAYGDGKYKDKDGRSYPVDAGLIGVVPVEVAQDDVSGAHKVTFASEFTCSYDNGVITLGSINIDTDADPEDDDEYCDGCYEQVDWCRCDEEEDGEDD